MPMLQTEMVVCHSSCSNAQRVNEVTCAVEDCMCTALFLLSASSSLTISIMEHMQEDASGTCGLTAYAV